MVNIRTESPIDTYSSGQNGDNSNFDGLEKNCLHIFLYINGSKVLVYVEWASRVNFVTIFGDLYQNKHWVICNNLNQFAHLSSASGPSNDVIKMATIVLLMYTY